MAREIRRPWVWNGVKHWTLGDVAETLQLITEDDEAQDFLRAYAEICGSEELASHNIGYIAQILSHDDENDGPDEARRICELFMTQFADKPMHTFGKSSLGIKIPVETAENEAA